ncbi:MAG TPA: hypothetical protein IAC04_06365 [Candidatus Coprenecus stercoravium]|uniref:Uncharacterized protein n=1 Tax=Candidatus Coprenecus stercoravium TaxID=2840735 RepID=A0A9D2GRV4_9BACT|nr:hypothetical protein [Candidatus Coprenecus stercoravium]
MKKLLAVLTVILAQLPAIAQNPPGMDMEIKQFEDQKVESTIEYYGDLPSRITKVVTASDNSMTDLLIRNAIEEGWTLSPYEFCTYGEFDKLKTDTSYYFLMRVDKMHRKGSDPAIEYLCFLKGNEEAGEDLSAMPELIALPLFPENGNSGRIFSYIPAYVNIIQNYLQKIYEGKLYPSKNGRIHLGRMDRSGIRTILLNEDDMAYRPAMQRFEKIFGGKAKAVPQDSIDAAMDNAAGQTLVSLVVAPETGSYGSPCWKILISADTYELYYFKKHKITPKKGPGFLKSDLRRISRMLKSE